MTDTLQKAKETTLARLEHDVRVKRARVEQAQAELATLEEGLERQRAKVAAGQEGESNG